jgi:hypothetical protein
MRTGYGTLYSTVLADFLKIFSRIFCEFLLRTYETQKIMTFIKTNSLILLILNFLKLNNIFTYNN